MFAGWISRIAGFKASFSCEIPNGQIGYILLYETAVSIVLFDLTSFFFFYIKSFVMSIDVNTFATKSFVFIRIYVST